MITEQDLREAIAECEGTRNPNASTCIKLAAFYTILNYMKGEPTTPLSLPQSDVKRGVAYSYDAGPHIDYSDSEFSQATEKRGIEQVFPIIDELMDALMVTNPRLYDSVIRKIENM